MALIALCRNARAVVAALLLGSVSIASDSSDARAQRYGVDAFGEVLTSSEASDGPIVRVGHRVGRAVSNGTATLVAHGERSSYFVTCAHLFDDGRGATEIYSPTLQRRAAEVVVLDRPHDLALLRAGRCGLQPVGYEEVGAARGDLMACGYGPVGQMRCVRGPLVGYATPNGARWPSLRLRGAVRPGDSGGPVFNERRRLVAVVWGQRAGETYATHGEPLRRILARLTQCRGGVCVRPQPQAPSGNRLTPVQREPAVDRWADWRASTDNRLTEIDKRLSDLSERLDERATRWESVSTGSTRLEAKIQAIAVKLDALDSTALERRIDSLEQRLADWRSAATPPRHFTLVADRAADYWASLGDEYRRAKEGFQGVRLADPPPGRVGPLPALVAWEDRTPVGSIEGYRGVSEALRRMSKGRAPQLN